VSSIFIRSGSLAPIVDTRDQENRDETAVLQRLDVADDCRESRRYSGRGIDLKSGKRMVSRTFSIRFFDLAVASVTSFLSDICTRQGFEPVTL
jgi:hypothetical protein